MNRFVAFLSWPRDIGVRLTQEVPHTHKLPEVAENPAAVSSPRLGRPRIASGRWVADRAGGHSPGCTAATAAARARLRSSLSWLGGRGRVEVIVSAAAASWPLWARSHTSGLSSPVEL